MSGEANAYVAELRAENARLREVVQRVEGLAYGLGDDLSEVDDADLDPPYMWHQSALSLHGDLCVALWGPPSTDTGPAPAGAYAATQGAGDGACWNESPAIHVGGHELARGRCELRHGHGGAHQYTDNPLIPPMRWMEGAGDGV